MLEQHLAEGGSERVMKILYGEGDRYGCSLDVAADAIVWHELLEVEAIPSGSTVAYAAAPLPQVIPCVYNPESSALDLVH